MDDSYILNKLLKWGTLFYGKDDKVFAKKKKGYYYFGTKQHTNKLTKQLALFMVTGSLPKFKNKK